MKPELCPLVVKICGITSLEDAQAALDAGADMLGFNFYPLSKRYIDPARCREIICSLSSQRLKAILVGVFVNAALAESKAIMAECGLHLAQLSGDEPGELLEDLGEAGFKALRVKGQADLQAAMQVYSPRAIPPADLIDSHTPGQFGGTGHSADWSAAAQISSRLPILLAGGLSPENVAQAVAQVHPWGVDVASGVEAAPGIKDHAKILSFVREARKNKSSTG